MARLDEHQRFVEALPNKAFGFPSHRDLPYLNSIPPETTWTYLAQALEIHGNSGLAAAVPTSIRGGNLSVALLQEAGFTLDDLAFFCQSWGELWITADNLLEAEVTGEPFRSSIKPEPEPEKHDHVNQKPLRTRKTRKHQTYRRFGEASLITGEASLQTSKKDEPRTRLRATEPANRNKTEALDPGFGAGFDDNYFENQEQIRDGLTEVAPEFFNLALNFVPIIGDFKGLAEAITGKDIAGNELATWERALGAVPVFGGFLKKVDAGNSLKAYIRMPGVWVTLDAVGNEVKELIGYLTSKLPDWRQRSVFAMAGESGFEAPEQMRRQMINAIEGGANSGQSLLKTYLGKFNLTIWKELRLKDTIENIITNTGLTEQQRQEVIQTLLLVENKISSSQIDLGDSGLQKNFREVVKKLNDYQYNVVEENLAELENAVRVIDEVDIEGTVAIGVTKGQKPKDLPEIDIEKVEADTYYKTSDGVIHLNEVKNTPNAFVSKLREGIKKEDGGQFKRYADWVEEGTTQNQTRQAMVVIRNSEPNFHSIIDNSILKELSGTIAKNNKDIPIIQIKDTKFTYNELKKFTKDAYKKLRELKELLPELEFAEIADEYFNSMEDAFKTMGQTYGH